MAAGRTSASKALHTSTARGSNTGRAVSHVVTRHVKGLTPDQVKAAVREMAKLKTHPREEQANRALLRRAERLFQELSLDQREELGRLLDGFEGALSLQDPAVIARHFEALEQFLTFHDDTAGGEEKEEFNEDNPPF